MTEANTQERTYVRMNEGIAPNICVIKVQILVRAPLNPKNPKVTLEAHHT